MKKSICIMREKILERLNCFKNRVDELGGYTIEIVCKEVATEKELLNIEKELGYKLPDDFRFALLNISSHLEFYWNLYNEDKKILLVQNELAEIFSGSLDFGIDIIPICEESRKGWIDICYPDYNKSYDKIFYNKLAFQQVENGDLLAIDLEEENYGKVIYLSHDGSDLHGYVMANSFKEFLEEYTKIGCVGGEDWQWEAFTNNHTTPIDSNSENAKKWLEIMFDG